MYINTLVQRFQISVDYGIWKRICLLSLILHLSLIGKIGSREIEHENRYSLSSSAMAEDDVLLKRDWEAISDAELEFQLNLKQNENQAKNVIIFIGDGMGIPDQTAARYLLAEHEGSQIDATKLAWEKWGYSGMAKTYNVDFQVPDSAATATAFFCGVKTQDGTVAVNQHVKRGNCSAEKGNEVTSALHRFIEEGKWAGVVSTARITHATPAVTYANSADRGWEADADMDAEDRVGCEDIAHQLVNREINQQIRVILGGGRQKFLPQEMSDPEYPNESGERLDGKDLINEWGKIKLDSGLDPSKYKTVFNKADFDAVDSATTDYILGLFEHSHMQYEVDRDDSPSGEPSLPQLTEKAIKMLSRSENGYFLAVEGGRIDHAHHDTNGHRALHEIRMLSEAVKVADELTSDEDTLIILTADHDHPFSFAGSVFIKNKILDLIRYHDGSPKTLSDEKPYLPIGYARGPGFHYHKPDAQNLQRIDMSAENTQDKEYLQDCTLPGGTSHGASDVAIYSRGPMAHLFTGSHEQHYIAKAYLYAACVGPNKKHCANVSNEAPRITLNGPWTIKLFLFGLVHLLGVFLSN